MLLRANTPSPKFKMNHDRRKYCKHPSAWCWCSYAMHQFFVGTTQSGTLYLWEFTFNFFPAILRSDPSQAHYSHNGNVYGRIILYVIRVRKVSRRSNKYFIHKNCNDVNDFQHIFILGIRNISQIFLTSPHVIIFTLGPEMPCCVFRFFFFTLFFLISLH
jgi:hypothetical protein